MHGAFRGLTVPQGQVPPGKRPAVSTSLLHMLSPSPSSSKAQSLAALRGGETQCSRGRSLQEPKDRLLGGTAPPTFLPGLCFSTLAVFLHSEPIPGQNTFSSIERIRRANKVPPVGTTGDQAPFLSELGKD